MSEVPKKKTVKNRGSKATILSQGNLSNITTEPKKSNLNVDHAYLQTILSRTLLNEQQKEEVKSLLSTELDSAITSVKATVAHESQETKKDFLTMFGIFVSFLTFISIEVQLFKTNNNISELIGLSSLFLAFMMLFALVLTHLSKTELTFKDLFKPIYIVTYTFIITGTILLINGNSIAKDHRKLSKKIEANENEIKELKKKYVEIKTPK